MSVSIDTVKWCKYVHNTPFQAISAENSTEIPTSMEISMAIPQEAENLPTSRSSYSIFFCLFFQSLLNYESFHFRPSSQHPLTPSPPPSLSLRAVRASSPVGSSSSSPLPPGYGPQFFCQESKRQSRWGISVPHCLRPQPDMRPGVSQRLGSQVIGRLTYSSGQHLRGRCEGGNWNPSKASRETELLQA